MIRNRPRSGNHRSAWFVAQTHKRRTTITTRPKGPARQPSPPRSLGSTRRNRFHRQSLCIRLPRPKLLFDCPVSSSSAVSDLARHAAMNVRAAVIAPVRRQRLQRLAAAGRAPAMVTFYHRVADRHPNAWTLSREAFTQHLDHFEQHFRLTDLAQVQTIVRQPTHPAANANRGDRSGVRIGGKPTLSVTFDDGYAENLLFAIPELLRRNIPVTYFVATGHIEHQRPFGHDLAAGQPLPVHNASELRQMASAGIEIGGHTRDHLDCSTTTDPAVLTTQIVDDRKRLQDLTGQAIRFFAFPFGLHAQLHPIAIEAVVRAGYDGFCSAYGGYNAIGGDGFHIRRFHGDPEMSRLKNWTSLDPAKQRETNPILYHSPHSADPAMVVPPSITTDTHHTTLPSRP